MTTLLETLKQSASAAMVAYRSMIVDAVNGAEVDPDEALKVAQAAGRSPAEMAEDLEIAARRIEAQQAIKDRDFPGEIERAIAEMRGCDAEADKIFEQINQLTATANEQRGRAREAQRRRSDLDLEQQQAKRRLEKLLSETCDDPSTPADPHNFMLAGTVRKSVSTADNPRKWDKQN